MGTLHLVKQPASLDSKLLGSMELNTLALVYPEPAQGLGLALLWYVLNELKCSLFN